ncbi:multiple sugar transport system substrate-binding protein [Paenibacillus catalpae]|uniref:Multiple sugar transport system substrate-binding protein n=1 Tax=Paenibacillus catalpae TaxID=1045775 RepID=A0A1I1SYR8_9BACL|nr:sugar ABC transporter substrate-binding protein [Paenibacillus catalpae]SFD51587.1 multiple sugar transport system substrate-binding protein [Paenibacillus catalpae]
MKQSILKGLTLLTLAATLALTACGNSGGNNGESNAANSGGKADPNAPVKLKIMWQGPDTRHQAMLKTQEVYTKLNPSVTFSPEYMAWDDYWKKLPTLAASHSLPDVLHMDGAYIQEFATRGTLEDLSDIDLTGVIDDKTLENLKIDGKLYGIPISRNAQGIAFNKEALAAAGIELPKKDWTWDEYFDFARNARAKLPEGVYPIGDSTTWDHYLYYQMSYGKGPIIQEDGKKFNLDKELFMKFYGIYAEFREKKIVPPADMGSAFKDNDPQADPMASGKVMTRGATVGSVGALTQLMPGKVGIVNMPVGPEGGGWAQPTIFLSVSTDAKHKDAAKAFIKWFVTEKEAGQTYGMNFGIPIYDDIYAALEPNLEEKDKLGKELYDVAKDKAMPFSPAAAGWTEWIDNYKKTMDAVMFGQKSLEDAYNEITKSGNAIAEKQSSK